MSELIYSTRQEVEATLSSNIQPLKRRYLESLKKFMTPSTEPLGVGEVLVRIGSVADVSSRVIAQFGAEGRRYGRQSATVVDKITRVLDISGSTILAGGPVIVDDVLLTHELGYGAEDWLKTGFHEDITKSLGLSSFEPELRMCRARVDSPLELADQRGYFLFKSQAAVVNFGHFIHDLMLQLHAYRTACEIAGDRLIPIFLGVAEGRDINNPFKFEIMTYLFRKCVYDGPVAFSCWRSVRPAKCYTSTLAFYAPKMALSEVEITTLRQAFMQVVNASAATAGRNPCLWVSRRDATVDRSEQYMSHNDSLHILDSIAELCGFEVISLGDCSFDKMLDHFKGAKVLAGMHGAGMFNSTLCPNLELMIECCYAPWTYETAWLIAEGSGVEVRRVPVAPSLVSDGHVVDLEALVRELRSAKLGTLSSDRKAVYG